MAKRMILQDDCGMDVSEHELLIDANGNEYFEVDGNKIMFMDFICPTPKMFVDNIEKYRDRDLCQILMKYGMDSIRVMLRKKKLDLVNFGGTIFGFDTSSHRDKVEDLDWVEYKFVNEDFSDPRDNYKLKLVPVDDKMRMFYGSERTYSCDLISLMQRRTDLYQVKANVNV
jgi:hypothetical protein